MAAFDQRVRQVHLELADAYTFRLRQTMRLERRALTSLNADLDRSAVRSAFSW
jgi:hypothetical protein